MNSSVTEFVQAAARADDLEDFARAALAFVGADCDACALWSRFGRGSWHTIMAQGTVPDAPPVEMQGDWHVVTVTVDRRRTSVGITPPRLTAGDRELLGAVLEAGLRRLEAQAAVEAATYSGDQRIATVLDAAPDAVLVVSTEGQILQANAQAVDLLGYPLDELVGSPVDRLVPDHLATAHAQHRERFTMAPSRRPMGAGQDLYARHRDGSAIPVDIALMPIEAAGQHAVAAFVRDASVRRRAEADRQQVREAELARRQALELNDNVVQGLTAAIWLLELKDRATALNTLRETLDEARHMMADLLDQSASPVAPGQLQRTGPSSGAQVDRAEEAAATSRREDVRVLLVDDSEAIRLMLSARLAMTPGLRVVGEAADGVDGLEAVAELRPDVVLMDLSMPRMDGLQATAAVRARHPEVRVVVLTGHAGESMRRQALDAGAHAYVEKGSDFEELIAAVLGEPVSG